MVGYSWKIVILHFLPPKSQQEGAQAFRFLFILTWVCKIPESTNMYQKVKDSICVIFEQKQLVSSECVFQSVYVCTDKPLKSSAEYLTSLTCGNLNEIWAKQPITLKTKLFVYSKLFGRPLFEENSCQGHLKCFVAYN